MSSISHATRQSKAEGYTEEGAIERWITTMSEIYDLPKEEIAKLAIVKLERERIHNEKMAVSNS